MRERNETGFTLIEVMVVLVMLVVLAALAYPAYLDAVRKARRAEGKAALLQLMQQQERFYSLHNRYIGFDSASQDAQARKFKWYSGEHPETSAYEIRAEACEEATLVECVVLIAQPGTRKVNTGFSDPVCGTLSLTSTGIRQAQRGDCWN